MKRTRKLCAVMIDSVGRELIINRPTQDDEDGWPTFEAGIAVEANQKACPVFICDHRCHSVGSRGSCLGVTCCQTAAASKHRPTVDVNLEQLQWAWIPQSFPELGA